MQNLKIWVWYWTQSYCFLRPFKIWIINFSESESQNDFECAEKKAFSSCESDVDDDNENLTVTSQETIIAEHSPWLYQNSFFTQKNSTCCKSKSTQPSESLKRINLNLYTNQNFNSLRVLQKELEFKQTELQRAFTDWCKIKSLKSENTLTLSLTTKTPWRTVPVMIRVARLQYVWSDATHSADHW